MKNYKALYLLILSIVLATSISFLGCKKKSGDVSPINAIHDHDEKADIPAPPYYGNNPLPVVLGNQLQNPYTIGNMSAAADALLTAGAVSLNTLDVRVTHEYIRFEPQTTDELLELLKDEDIQFYGYPLDYEIEREGNWYRDPEITDDEQPTYQYASIKIGHTLNPKIHYTVLSELYIPEEDEILTGIRHDENLDFLDKLLTQAYEQTDNEEKEKKRWSWYTPAGNITIFDTRLNANIPLEGAKVTASRWFTTYTTNTDANGNFSMSGSFKRPCDYKLWFSRTGFVIGDNWLQPSNVIRNNIHGNWNYNIGLGYENMQGHMFRGAFRYFFQNVQGLRRPNRTSGLPSMIVAKNSNKDWSGINYIVLPILKIARYRSPNTEYASDEYYSTTIHELAHTTHVMTMNAGAVQFSQVNTLIMESWPTAIEWLLTGLEYKSRGIVNYGDWNYSPSPAPQYPNDRGYQYWSSTTNAEYTNLFINLIDNYNESIQYVSGANDVISSYTLSGIENDVLKHSYGLSSLSQHLKSNKPTGVTNAQIDQLLSFY